MKTKKGIYGVMTIFLIMAVVASLLGGALPMFAQEDLTDPPEKMVDQSCCQEDGTRCIFCMAPIGQEFRPCSSPLVGVDIYLSTVNPGPPSDIIRVNIRQGTITGGVMGSASATISSGFEGFYYFDLGTITVTPGNTYVIEVIATNPLFGWSFASPDYYPNGRAITNGNPSANSDQAFRTYTLVPTVWKYIVTEHIERKAGDMFVGDYFTFPFPPCCTGPKEIGIHTSYSSMLIDMEDFDNDGDFDYLVMKEYLEVTGPQAWFLLYTNIGDLTFTETVVDGPIALSTNLWEAGNIGLTAADFNGDGWPDFAATIPKTGTNLNEIHFYKNNGGSLTTFTHLTAKTIVANWAAYARDMDAGDFDEDGDFDFVMFDYPWGADGNFAIYWYENTSPATWSFTPHSVVDSGGTPITTLHSVGMIVAGDFGSPGQGLSDGWLDFIVGQDDDGDPGQTWIYFNKPGGASGVLDVDGPYEAYDLNPGPAGSPAETGSDQPGAGLADALDCNADGKLDIIATAGTADPLKPLLYFVEGRADGTFKPPVIKYGGNLDGAGLAVAAPPVWFYPMAKFIAHFMTPEGEPYPFDVIISDGTWRKEWKNVTDIETEVPCDATYTIAYEREGILESGSFSLTFNPGTIHPLEFYAISHEQMIYREQPYIAFQEEGANTTLTSGWNSTDLSLKWTVSVNPEKYAGIAVGIDEDVSSPPNYVMQSNLKRCRFYWSHIKKPPFRPCTIDRGHIWISSPHSLGEEVRVQEEYSVTFEEIPTSWGTVRIGSALDNGAILVYPISTVLRNLNGTQEGIKDFLDPQYAVEGNKSYILSINNLPDGYAQLDYPVYVRAGDGVDFDVFPLRVMDIQDFTFSVAGEFFCAKSRYSNLVWSSKGITAAGEISVDVNTETDYDWWGCFVLPDIATVAAARSYDGNVWHDLQGLYDYTIDSVDGYNIVVVRITPETERLILQYAPVRPCFIATAAYGTPMADEIQILREFKDEYLLTNAVGRALVDIYYKVSPPIAGFITEHPSLKPIVRASLVPAVAMSTIVVNTTPAEKMAMVGLVVLVSVALAIWTMRRRRRGPEHSRG